MDLRTPDWGTSKFLAWFLATMLHTASCITPYHVQVLQSMWKHHGEPLTLSSSSLPKTTKSSNIILAKYFV